MRIAVVTGPGAVELRDEPAPVVGSEEVLVEVGACGLCTMERRLFAGEKQIYPVAPGHEAAGEVVEINESLDGAAERVNADPYGDGWMIKMRVESTAELQNLLSAKDYEELIADA